MTTVASPVGAAMSAPRAATRGRQQPKPTKQRGLTIATGAIILYLFVVHSYKVNLGSVAVILGMIGVLLYERPLRIATPMVLYGAFLLWNLLLLPLSVNTTMSWDAWVEAVKLFLIMLMAFNALRNPAQHRLLTLAWLAMFAFYPVRGTLFNFVTGQGEQGRYGWNFAFENYNDLAAFTLMPLAMCIERLISTESKWVKYCALSGVVTLPFLILITGSRGGLLGLGVMLTYVFFRSRFRLKIIAVMVPVAALAMLFAPKSMWDRIRRMEFLTDVSTLDQADTSAVQRYMIWQVAKSIIKENPIGGVGIGVYPVVHARKVRVTPEWKFAGGRRDAHSTYLRVCAESGIIGLIIFISIFLSASFELSKALGRLKNRHSPRDEERRGRFQAYQGALAGLAVCAVFGSLQVVVFPFLFVAMSAAAVRLTGEEHAPASLPRAA